MLLNGQPQVRAEEYRYAAGEVEPDHSHNEHQLLYASTGLLCVDTESTRWILPPFRAAWIPANTRHVVTATIRSTMSTLYIAADTEETADLAGVVVISVEPLLRELILHLCSRPAESEERVRIERVVFDRLRATRVTPLEQIKLVDERICAIAEVLECDPCDRRTLPQFGRMVGASERTLQRLFLAETGSTFGQWRTQLRLQHGVVALGQGASVTAAAIGSGYREPSSFIAAFRSTFGTTPGRYFDCPPVDMR